MIFLFVLALVLLVYSPVLTAQPTYDDVPYFVDPEFRQPLKDFSWLHPTSWYHRPLTTAMVRLVLTKVPERWHVPTFKLAGQLGHVINSWLVYAVVLHWLDPVSAAVAMLAFAVSPLAVPAVSTLANLSTVGSTTFSLGAVWLALQHHPVVALAAIAVGVLVREDVVVALPLAFAVAPSVYLVGLPVLFLLRYGHRVRHALLWKLRSNGDEGMRRAGFTESLPQPQYTLTAIPANLSRWLPWNLGLWQNPDPRVDNAKSVTKVVGIATLVAAIILTFYLQNIGKVVLLFVLVSPWAASWLFRLPDIVAEGRAYSTIVGFALLVGWLLPLTAAIHLLLWLTLAATYRCFQRRHPVPYWLSAWRPRNPKLRVAVNIAGAYQNLSDMDNAMKWHQIALELSPTNGVVWANIALWHEGRARQARQAVAQDLVTSGACDSDKFAECTQAAAAHLTKALEVMAVAVNHAPEEATVLQYAAAVQQHGRVCGLIK